MSDILDMHGPLAKAIHRRDWAFVAAWTCGRFRVEVDVNWVGRTGLPSLRESGRVWIEHNSHWSDGSWCVWLKKRLDESGVFRTECRGTDVERLTVELHTGWVELAVTEEERNERWQEEFETDPLPATPGIERVMTMPEPIDRTAARVVPGSGGSD